MAPKREMWNYGEYDIKIEFISNSAQYGGAVFILRDSGNTIACERSVQGTDSDLALSSLQECFIQSVLLGSTDTQETLP